MKTSKGFTLVELIVALAISLMVITVSWNMFFLGIRSHSGAIQEFNVQSEIRVAMEKVNRSIRFSTAVFAVTGDSFSPVATATPGIVSGLTEKWNYFGLSPDGKQLVTYKYIDDATSPHYKKHQIDSVVSDFGADTVLTLQFDKTSEALANKILGFTVVGKKNGTELFTYTSELEALNALQVFDRGDSLKPAIALAYRVDERPQVERVTAAVSLVLDMSGSMNADMNGNNRNDTNPPANARINILRDRARELIDVLEKSYVSIVPFSTSANIPHSSMPAGVTNPSAFRSVDNATSKQELKTIISGLRASGATNTGDGMRQGYYQLENFFTTRPPGLQNHTIKYYMIILVDGATNIGVINMTGRSGPSWNYSYHYETNTPAVINPGNLKRNLQLINDGPFINTNNNSVVYDLGLGIIGNPYAGSETTHGNNYVQLIGNELIKKENPFKITTFVIGFSNVPSDLVSVGKIATSTGITVAAGSAANQFVDNDYIYIATDANGLSDAFKRIGGMIEADLWQVFGP